ncbi:MAG: hypothetical protein ACLUOF_11075 [Ruminococcus sp.]
MKKVGILLLTGALLLCSCGQAKETAESSADVPETIQTNLTANPYFDISDLTYDGTETQNIAIGYSFEDPADNDPVLTYDRYLSADGETFCLMLTDGFASMRKAMLIQLKKQKALR